MFASLFFEQCLNWKGVVVEPNPHWAPYHKAYRPNAQLLQHCVWNSTMETWLSFEKDTIEATVLGPQVINN